MLFVNCDVSALADLSNMSSNAEKAIQDAVRDLSAMTHGKALEFANELLHSRRQMFVDALHYSQVSDDTWVISLDAKMRWIDDGMEPHDMKPALLASKKAKTAADGSKYLVVPFNHGPGKGATSTTPAQHDLISTIKTEMKSRGIPFGKLEKGDDGLPKTGKLHSFNIMQSPTKTHEGPGQGRGPIGSVRQGKTGIPFLQGVNVYQSKVKGADGAEKVKKSIMTFRIVSSKQSNDVWSHPGLEPVLIFEKTADWAQATFDKDIAPAIISKILSSM